MPLGGHGPLTQIRNVPRYLGWLAMFGPGAIYVATAQGSGELVISEVVYVILGVYYLSIKFVLG